MHYVERGSRSPVVFLHGNDVMIDGYSWPASNRRHRANSMVIGFHLRGTASVNQQKIAASDLPRALWETTQMIGGPMRRTAVVDHTHFL